MDIIIVKKGYIIDARSDNTRRREVQAVPEEVYNKVENIKLYGKSWGISFVYAPESGEF